jgi:GntR family transcriptional regulator/MocR family aminotransferase
VPSAAGLHVAARLAPGVTLDLADVVTRARRRGVAVLRLADFAVAPSSGDGLVLGFGAIADRDIDDGLARLAGACAAAER